MNSLRFVLALRSIVMMPCGQLSLGCRAHKQLIRLWDELHAELFTRGRGGAVHLHKLAAEAETSGVELPLEVGHEELDGRVVVMTRYDLRELAVTHSPLTMSAYLDDGCTKLS